MNLIKVEAVRAHAQNVILKCDAAAKRLRDDKYLYASKETAALRRASMDMTRALAELRKP